jgi:hypothetical protein
MVKTLIPSTGSYWTNPGETGRQPAALPRSLHPDGGRYLCLNCGTVQPRQVLKNCEAGGQLRLPTPARPDQLRAHATACVTADRWPTCATAGVNGEHCSTVRHP